MPRTRIANGAWVLVGDGRKAMLLRNDGLAEQPNLHCIATREQPGRTTNRPAMDGRILVDSGESRMDVDETDRQDEEVRRFAAGLAAELNSAAYEQRYEDLILVAPPRILAELRHDLNKEAKARVRAEIGKDLVRHTIADIESILLATA